MDPVGGWTGPTLTHDSRIGSHGSWMTGMGMGQEGVSTVPTSLRMMVVGMTMSASSFAVGSVKQSWAKAAESTFHNLQPPFHKLQILGVGNHSVLVSPASGSDWNLDTAYSIQLIIVKLFLYENKQTIQF